jgi:hypothetical protein
VSDNHHSPRLSAQQGTKPGRKQLSRGAAPQRARRMTDADERAAQDAVTAALVAAGGKRKHRQGRAVELAGFVVQVRVYSGGGAIRAFVSRERHVDGEISFLPEEATDVGIFIAQALLGRSRPELDLDPQYVLRAGDWMPGRHLYAWTRSALANQDAITRRSARMRRAS